MAQVTGIPGNLVKASIQTVIVWVIVYSQDCFYLVFSSTPS